MAEHISPRVNATRLAEYIGRTVRLTCKVVRSQSDVAIVQAPDGGEVSVRLTKGADITAPFIEVIGAVVDAGTVRMLACINLGDDLDMDLVNDVVEVWHDPRFAKMV
ncbi:replication factor A protein 3 [Fomitopsis serialis]|uniref:replication factor A protein 3 n=1 Tax=Fomitopsis serialis TaxID=139415 RepID=UPI00200838D0|nr:replication factor A protein 3 [Neoantrodia serialis]KAH9933050.1 replication factor A protein 3 [Neoantrodia serialis]